MPFDWPSRAGVVNVRPAVAADVPELESIAKAAYLPYVPRMGFLPAPATADYAAAVARGEVWLARTQAHASGLIVLVAKPGYLLLENVAVLPSMHGFGIGTGLLAFAEAQARELGLPEVRLYTNVAMTENQALYRRRGYVETHRDSVGGLSRVYFTKRLLSGRLASWAGSGAQCHFQRHFQRSMLARIRLVLAAPSGRPETNPPAKKTSQ